MRALSESRTCDARNKDASALRLRPHGYRDLHIRTYITYKTNVQIHTYMYLYMTHINTCIHSYIYKFTHRHIHTFISKHIHTFIYIHAYVYIHAHIRRRSRCIDLVRRRVNITPRKKMCYICDSSSHRLNICFRTVQLDVLSL